MVNVADLNIDPEVQRVLTPGWVKAHTPIFDVELLGYIVVNRRPNLKLFVVDGQHRVELLRAVGWGDQNIHAEYFEGLSKQEEAALFVARNDRRAVRTIDKFRIRAVANDDIAIGVYKVANDAGVTISDRSGTGHVTAVKACEDIYKGGGIASLKEGKRALGDAFRVILKAWGPEPSNLNGKVIHAMGLVQLRYNGRIDQSALAAKLAPFPGGAPGLLGRAKSSQGIHGGSVQSCAAALIVDIYNRGRRQGKLDAWKQ